jgi:hypothetical protein
MALTKPELIEKLTKVHQFIVGLENLNTEKNNRWDNVKNAESNLHKNKQDIKQWIGGLLMFGIPAGILFLIYYYTSWTKMRTGAIICGVIVLLFVWLLYSEIKGIKSSKKQIMDCQNEFDGMDKKFTEFFSQNEQEINDTNAFFPGDNYPFSRHVEYGINCLTSGRADDYKEFMALVDEQIHREKLEYNSQVQTENTRQAVAYSKAALSAANAAASAANAAAENARRAANTSHTVYIRNV